MSEKENIRIKLHRPVEPIEAFPHLPAYAPQFFFVNLKYFWAPFLLLTLVSISSELALFGAVYLLSDLTTHLLQRTEAQVLGWYLPLLAGAFLIKEALDFFTRRYGEGFATVYGDHLSLRFYKTILMTPYRGLRNVAPQRLIGLAQRYVGHVRGWAEDWFWGSSRRVVQVVIIIGVLLVQGPWVLAGNLVFLMLFLAFSFAVSRRFSPVAAAFSRQDIESGTTIGGFLVNLSLIRRLGLSDFFMRTAVVATDQKLQQFDAVRRFHARRWFVQLNIYRLSYLGTLVSGAIGVIRGHLGLGYLVLIKYAFDSLYGVLAWCIEYRVQLVQQKVDALLLEEEFAALWNPTLEAAPVDLTTLPNVTGGTSKFSLELKDAVAEFHSEVQGGAQLRISVPSLIVRAGARIGIQGPSGAGKSTILNMLAGVQPFYGSLLCNQQEVVSARQRADSPLWVADQVVLIQGNDPLFHVTLRDNILLGRVTSEERYREILKAAALDEVIVADKAMIGTRDVNLSAGQLQRVRIARGILPASIQILLLDEPFNGIDDCTRARIWSAIQALHPHAAIVLVSHRPDELEGMQERYHIVAGRLVPLSSSQLP